MPTVNVLEAKTQLSKLIDAVESGREAEIIIARNGKPAVRIVPLAASPPARPIGVAAGRWAVPDPDPELDREIAQWFLGGPAPRSE